MASVGCQFFRELRNNHEYEEALKVDGLVKSLNNLSFRAKREIFLA